ncbi:O-antigen ligase [Janthinobacterium sp. HH103]|uniref:O-antigen ligase family protein n=1 Tax=Janthinobacterium agaricidamnosum TaxID=55508 RepID=A0A3G2EGL6_9BURK|nr:MULTISPECIES: O-antigen ligase family protein [Janthinobacterium]AYM78125.1 O-antigen ligase family protein [Janthinobacterium agaricidamnosum]OEZ68319.1 O-antigen ligase [Janthinobacterium sp. HH103]OEZ68690.1 O-antigen ligase [Janthinobacterium sp. HH100]OFA07417.1 O-antigen ligase [Janthinobacterium sp. HH107]QOU75484.1 O-Antigen ligase [Janthinobacterium sp. HH102]
MLGLTSVCVFLFSALALPVTSGYSLGALVLLLASSWLLWKRPRLNLQRQDYLMLGTLLLYFCIFTANMLYHADPARELDIPLRALLAIPVLLLLIAYPPRPEAWWAGLAVGAIAGTALAMWQFFIQDMPRPLAATSNAIHYGNISILLGMLAMCGLDWASMQAHRWLWRAVMLLGCLAGIVGSIISGSRGGWIALPVCLIFFVVHHSKKHGKRYLMMGLLALAGLSIVAYVLPHSTVKERITLGISNIHTFEDRGEVDTSIGQRLEMWRTAIDMSQQRPWTGLGRNGYMEQKSMLVAEGKANISIRRHTNAHNDYLDTMVKRGIIGVLALLALFLVPLALFARSLRQSSPAAQPYALAGVVLCTCYLIFGLTTSSLTLNIGIIMLVFPMVILWALLRQQERTA